MLTDPPYLVSRKSGFAAPVTKGVERFRVSKDFGAWDNKTGEEHTLLMESVVEECFRVLREGGTFVCFYDLWKITSLASILENGGFRMLRFIEWIKTNPVPLNSKVSYLTGAREIAIVAAKGSKPRFNSSYHNGVFSMPIHRDGGRRIHPTQKPLALMAELVEIHSNKGDVVLDPFAGSATTLVAASNTGRTAMGCEISKEYYRSAVKRLERECPVKLTK